MAVDYDLVILGGTAEGVAAAAEASRYGARVALVRQGLEGDRWPLVQRGRLQLTAAHPFAVPPPHSQVPSWQWAKQRATVIADALTQDQSSQLMVRGVDVIAERGQLVSDRPLTLTTPTRKLTTRAMLVATGSTFRAPQLAGLEQVPYQTVEEFWQGEHWPSSVTILGSSPEALALAQWLTTWQVDVHLITAKRALLDMEDPEVSRWLTAQLKAAGVNLRLGAHVLSVSLQTASAGSPSIAVKLANDTISAAALVVATALVPNLDALSLTAVLPRDRPPVVNAFLQSEHPHIYLCGAAMGGYELPAIARQEAESAVYNALFWNRRRLDYQAIPYELPMQPPLTRVGLTEPQAYERYDHDDILVARQSLYDNPPAQWRESTAGFCKLIAHRDGRFLGCHGIGPESPEWVQIIALLMRQKTPWWHLAEFSTLPYSFAEVLRQAAQQWQSDRWHPGQWRFDWSENWCNWRRSR